MSYDGHHECQLWYKSVVALVLALASARVVNYAPEVTLQIVASLTDNPRGVVYNCKMFIIQAVGQWL